jgi:hypothetical protein
MTIVFIVFGWGLWTLQNWARENLIGMILLCWLCGGISFNGFLFGEGIVMDDWSRQTLVCALILDLTVFCCLVFYPDVRKAFGERD